MDIPSEPRSRPSERVQDSRLAQSLATLAAVATGTLLIIWLTGMLRYAAWVMIAAIVVVIAAAVARFWHSVRPDRRRAAALYRLYVRVSALCPPDVVDGKHYTNGAVRIHLQPKADGWYYVVVGQPVVVQFGDVTERLNHDTTSVYSLLPAPGLNLYLCATTVANTVEGEPSHGMAPYLNNLKPVDDKGVQALIKLLDDLR